MNVYRTTIKNIDVRVNHDGEFIAEINFNLPQNENFSFYLRLQNNEDVNKFKTILSLTKTRHACALKGKSINMYLTDSNDVVAIGSTDTWKIYKIDDFSKTITMETLYDLYKDE